MGTASAAAYQYFDLGGGDGFFGERVRAIPEEGPVGMRPFLELAGYDRGREVAVYMCGPQTADISDCAELGRGVAPERMRAAPIPRALPNATEVVPATYSLRAGPDEEGNFPVRGSFQIVPFGVGERPQPASLAGVDPSALRIGEAREIARGASCRPPLFLPDGRLAVGATVVDPTTGVTIEFDIPASELAWSPVGDKLAILTPDRKEIRLAGPDGTDAVTAVREARGLLSSLSWAPQGDRLAFIAQDDPNARGGPGPPTVRILDALTSQASSAGPGLAVSWSTRPDVLAVERAGGVLEASTATGERRSLVSGHRAAWSPDGSLLAFIRTGETGAGEGWIARSDGSAASPVVSGGVCALSFSPTGATIAVVFDREGRTSLVLRRIERPE